jgi:hypothetical protein
MTHDNIHKTFQEKLHNTFLNPTFQKPIRHPDVAKVDRFLGKKGARKFLGRNRSSRGKVKSRRKNNYKTLNARKILQSRHGVANSLKKIDNKYLLTYGDIAKLMRKFHYVYDQMLRKWVAKTPRDKKKEEPIEKKADKEPQDKEKGDNGSSGGDKDKDTGNEPEEGKKKDIKPFEFKPIDKKEPKKEHKDRLKSTQGRIILISMGQEDCAEYTIIPDDIQYKVPDADVLMRCSEKGLLWLKKRDKFTDYKGKDPNLLEGYRGTLGRAILIGIHKFYSFLSFEEENLDMVNEKMEELGYEFLDGSWHNTEEEQENLTEAAGTSSSPAAMGPGQNTQGIARFNDIMPGDIKKRKFL